MGARSRVNSPKAASSMSSGRCASTYARNAVRLLPLAESTPIFLDSTGVLRQCAGEPVGAGTIGSCHEIQVVARGGGEGCPERGQARIRDRSRRQAGVLVSVIELLVVEVGAVDRSAVALFNQRGVD